MKIRNSLGLSVDFLENGSLKSIEAAPIRISLRTATLFSKGGTNLYLRKRTQKMEFAALLGPDSNSLFGADMNMFFVKGSWSGIDYECRLGLSEESLSWKWTIDLKNRNTEPVELDLIYVQDIGLKAVASGPVNEYYVSQYLERIILEDKKHGSVVCCRQNMREPTGNPWLLIASIGEAKSASVDGIQFYGRTYREGGFPEALQKETLGGEYAGESSVVALQEAPFMLPAGKSYRGGFVASYMPDHPEATSEDDLQRLDEIIAGFGDSKPFPGSGQFVSPERNIFNSAPFLPVDDLNRKELVRFFGEGWRHAEEEDGNLLSFFTGNNCHVVLRSKEILADRPHAHIMQADAGYVPDERIMSTTSFAFGVFNSHITQGNTNFNVLLSVCTSQFNLSPETGQRIFVEAGGRKFLLGVPSAFEIGLNHCRWIYKYGDTIFQIRNWTSKKVPQINMDFSVISGNKTRVLITHQFDSLSGWTISEGDIPGEYLARPDADSMIAGKFPGARFRIRVNSVTGFKACGDEALYEVNKNRESTLFVLDVSETSAFCMSIIGEVGSVVNEVKIESPDKQWLSDCHDALSAWQDLSMNLSLKGSHKDIAAIQEILPWFGMNALTHFLTPYGLEQFSGAAWGTRDVSQGPFDLLLCMGKYKEAREVLQIIFSNQNPDGGWPQWWMFDCYSHIRADSSHGDIYYWCLIALSNYIKVTGDLSVLDEVLPYYHEKGASAAEKEPLCEHAERLIKMIVDSFIPGTALVPFDGGDWNDSLQPVSKELAQRMISTWTVEMNYQAFSAYSDVYKLCGNGRKADELEEICDRIKTDFNRYLIRDGIVAGYGLAEKDHCISVLLHPIDETTGIRYSILPMNRGIISEIFSREQARLHQELIEKYLKGPDGARLMDRPLRYKGGIQTIFQRAESSTFFGREIGLMYVHEHIRYAEALARTGKADAFVRALRQAIPVDYRDIVPCGDIRQANCYYSSSDVAFRNRYEADDLYDEIKSGRVTLRGGWRVYSSGPGIFIALIITRLLGLRAESGKIIIDPVLPAHLDGLSASMNLFGHSATFRYSVRNGNFSPEKISVNDIPVKFSLEENRYRKGGAVIPSDLLFAMMDKKENIIDINL